MAVDTARSPHDHSVQFYQSDLFLADVVATFLEEGFHAGDVALVIATPQHQALFSAQLAGRGLDVAALLRHQRLVMLDATEAVRRIVDHGRVDEAAFHEFVGPSLQALATHAAGANVRAYGEIVDLLWGAGERSAAIRLEELWNALRERHRFSLLCAYLMDSFVKHHGIGDVCATHTLSPRRRRADTYDSAPTSASATTPMKNPTSIGAIANGRLNNRAPSSMSRDAGAGRPDAGRNAPCPHGSGPENAWRTPWE